MKATITLLISDTLAEKAFAVLRWSLFHQCASPSVDFDLDLSATASFAATHPLLRFASAATNYLAPSSYKLFTSCRALARTMDSLPPPILEAIRFEKSNDANGSVFEDGFYSVPSGAGEAAPGTLLKLEENADTTRYFLPPATAMSRFIYQTESLKGTSVPASASILWPYSPKSHQDGYSVVVWAHGTSGVFAGGTPSNHKNLWQHFLAPYQLVSQGYVVVSPDYAGLGVSKTDSGAAIVHEYLSGPSQANDIIFAVQAAQAAFKELSKSFVVVGHSQGGGAAWATAQRQALHCVTGYLGAVAISPVTSIINQPEPFRSVIMTAMCPGLFSAFPALSPSTVLTTEGQQRLQIIQGSGAGFASGMALLVGAVTLNADWTENPHVHEYHSMIENGGKTIKAPLLVIHGEDDDKVSAKATADAIKSTSDKFPSSQLEFVLIPNVGHVPALQASQRLWMEWIADRFAGKDVESAYKRTTMDRARPSTAYQAEQNWYIEPATQFFHAP